MKYQQIARRILLAAVVGLGSAAGAMAQSYQVYSPNSQPNSEYRLGVGLRYNLNYYSHSHIGFNMSPEGGAWRLGTDGANNGGAGIFGGVGGTLLFVNFPTSNGSTYQTVTDQDINNNIKMSLEPNGTLRIGRKSPQGIHNNALLSVYGKAACTSIVVLPDNSTNWADYVFADSYRLRPLSEVASYIKQNRHLPEIPTTQEVEKDGINVAQINTLLLKKVEELTLYMIEMEQRTKALEAQLAAAKQTAAPVSK